MWAMGNIAGDSTQRDVLLKHGALQPLLKIIEDPAASEFFMQYGTWAAANLCRGRPLPKIEEIQVAIPTFCKIISSQTKIQVLIDAAWTLSYLTFLSTNEESVDVVKMKENIGYIINCPKTISALVSLLS